MESPQRASAACARSEKSGLSDVSFPRPDSPLLRQSDSFAESQQCSADPSAFLGFHVPPSAEEVDVAPPKDPQLQSKKKTFKLVLDLGLDSTSGADDGCRPLQSPANPFSELFAGDTQDDENLMATRAPIIAEEKEKEKKKKEENSTQKKNIEREKEHVSPPKRRRQSEEEKEGDRSPSPPPTMLMSIDKELRDRKQKVTAASAGEVKEKDEESHDEMRLEDSLPGASAFSEYSEDLAPRVFQTFATNVEAAAIDEKSALVEGDNERFDRSAYITEDSDRETDLEEDMELTQKLDDEEVDVVMDSKDVTRSYAASSGDDEEETEAFPYSGTGTEPYGPDSACMDDDHDELAKNAGNQTLDMSVNGGGSHHVPTPSQKSDQRTSDDDVTSRECTQQDYLTPRVNPNQIDNADSAEVNEKSVVVSDKQNSNKSPDEDDQDECMATQPSRGRTEMPAGYSVTTRKFECFTPRELNIFEGYSFGIATDVEQVSKAEAKDKANLMAFILKACGADAVYENISAKSDVDVDIVLCSEYTQTCRYYKKRRRVLVKDFQWVTECMILQQFLDPEEDPVLEPQRVGCEDVFSASAEIGDSDRTTLKLYTGELVMADISGSAADHYLLFNVCEILSIHVSGGRKDEGSQSKRKDKESRVMLHVGMLKREPYNPELSKTPVKVLDISSSQVKRRVVAISKEDYGRLKYKDESIFCVEDASEPDKPTLPEHRWLTQ
ncbi:hypothetical protein PF004_g18828 [Phytophthora fragariae]|uniref:BRCT domain-containing protein n=1 Tax=Phytophthora fragariae TaxID=53985 RepID=A0A6G0NBE7_9STRA|nr:hypothetical protein PF004_g18828 [Phytophthora fragariae]